MYKVFPIALTMPNWQLFDKIAREYGDFSPIKHVDNANLNIKDPSAFSMSLVDKSAYIPNDPIFEHTSMTFSTISDSDTLLDLTIDTDLKILHKVTKYNEHFVIMSGTVREWFEAIYNGCHLNSSYGERKILNGCYEILAQSRFSQLWNDLQRDTLQDGTFVWRRR